MALCRLLGFCLMRKIGPRLAQIRVCSSNRYVTDQEAKNLERDTHWRSWLSHFFTNRKVAGSIPVGVIEICH